MKQILLIIAFMINISFLNSIDIILANFSNSNYSIKIEKENKTIIQIKNFENSKISKKFSNIENGEYKVFLKNIYYDKENLSTINDWYLIDTISFSDINKSKKYFVYLNYKNGLTVIDFDFQENNFLFLNETGRELTVLKIADDWEEENFGFMKYDIENGFYKVKEGRWYIMWRYKDDERQNRFFYVKEKNYEKKIIDFTGRKIVFIIYKNRNLELYNFLNINF